MKQFCIRQQKNKIFLKLASENQYFTIYLQMQLF